MWEVVKLLTMGAFGLIAFAGFIYLVTLSKFVLIGLAVSVVIWWIVIKVQESRKPDPHKKPHGTFHPKVRIPKLKLPDARKMKSEQYEEKVALQRLHNTTFSINNEVDLGEVLKSNDVMTPEELAKVGKTRIFYRRPTVRFKVGVMKIIRH